MKKDMKETIANINKTKVWFFEKIDKTDKPLARIIEKKGRRFKSIKSQIKKSYNRQCKNEKDHKRVLWTNICQ